MVFTEGEKVAFAIMYTFLYTIVSTGIAFKLNDLLDDEIDVGLLAKHFILWPIECLFIAVLCAKVYLVEKGYIKTKTKAHKK